MDEASSKVRTSERTRARDRKGEMGLEFAPRFATRKMCASFSTSNGTPMREYRILCLLLVVESTHFKPNHHTQSRSNIQNKQNTGGQKKRRVTTKKQRRIEKYSLPSCAENEKKKKQTTTTVSRRLLNTQKTKTKTTNRLEKKKRRALWLYHDKKQNISSDKNDNIYFVVCAKFGLASHTTILSVFSVWFFAPLSSLPSFCFFLAHFCGVVHFRCALNKVQSAQHSQEVFLQETAKYIYISITSCLRNFDDEHNSHSHTAQQKICDRIYRRGFFCSLWIWLEMRSQKPTNLDAPISRAFVRPFVFFFWFLSQEFRFGF